MINTPITEMLGIEYPVFQGGMAWVADGKLAAAVSNGGGLGIIAAGNAPVDVVREEIHIAKSLTDKPFGVNIMLMSPSADEVAALVCEEKVAVVTTGAGNPSKYIEAWKQAGIKVIPVVASVALAKLMQRLGADAVIAEGGESGGHVGELNTMVLVPLIADAVTIPVLAAGGIADGRGFAASFMLAACRWERVSSLQKNAASMTNIRKKSSKPTTAAPPSPANVSVILCAACAPISPVNTRKPNTAASATKNWKLWAPVRCAKLSKKATARTAASWLVNPARS